MTYMVFKNEGNSAIPTIFSTFQETIVKYLVSRCNFNILIINKHEGINSFGNCFRGFSHINSKDWVQTLYFSVVFVFIFIHSPKKPPY